MTISKNTYFVSSNCDPVEADLGFDSYKEAKKNARSHSLCFEPSMASMVYESDPNNVHDGLLVKCMYFNGDLFTPEPANQLEMAEQQFTGFAVGKDNGDVVELINSMGLEETEWSALKNGEDCTGISAILDGDDIGLVDDYFWRVNGSK